MTDPKEPYEVDPGDAAAKEPAPPPASDPGKPRLFDIPLPPPTQPKGKIEAPELLAGFEKDADFDKDPELDRVIMGKPVKADRAEKEPEAAAPVEDFVQPGLGGAKVWAIAGVVLLFAAMIATGIHPAANVLERLLRVLLILYHTVLHTGTGVVAVFVAATLLGKRLGSFELAAARMSAAVGAVALMMSLKLSLFGYTVPDRLLVLIFASGAYLLLVASTFNVWKRLPLAYIAGSHFFLWLIVAVGMLLSEVTISTKVSPVQPAPEAPAVKAPAKPAAPTGSPPRPATGP